MVSIHCKNYVQQLNTFRNTHLPPLCKHGMCVEVYVTIEVHILHKFCKHIYMQMMVRSCFAKPCLASKHFLNIFLPPLCKHGLYTKHVQLGDGNMFRNWTLMFRNLTLKCYVSVQSLNMFIQSNDIMSLNTKHV